MNTVSKLLVGIFIIVISTGCNILKDTQTDTSQSSEVKEGIDIQKNPIAAFQKVIELGQNADKIQETIANKEPVNPVSFKELIDYLPQAPRGWTPEKPKGETNSLGNYSISQVSQIYTDGNKKIEVKIFDWAFNSALYTPFLLSTEFSQESTEGYNKGIKLGDIPGREEYTYSSKQGSLNLLVNSRFLIQIDGRNIEDVELREWWELINHKSLNKITS